MFGRRTLRWLVPFLSSGISEGSPSVPEKSRPWSSLCPGGRSSTMMLEATRGQWSPARTRSLLEHPPRTSAGKRRSCWNRRRNVAAIIRPAKQSPPCATPRRAEPFQRSPLMAHDGPIPGPDGLREDGRLQTTFLEGGPKQGQVQAVPGPSMPCICPFSGVLSLHTHRCPMASSA